MAIWHHRIWTCNHLNAQSTVSTNLFQVFISPWNLFTAINTYCKLLLGWLQNSQELIAASQTTMWDNSTCSGVILHLFQTSICVCGIICCFVLQWQTMSGKEQGLFCSVCHRKKMTLWSNQPSWLQKPFSYIIHESILQFPSILENNFPVSGEPSYLYSITLELTKPWTFERAVRSQSIAQSSGTSYSLGILSRKTLPKVC